MRLQPLPVLTVAFAAGIAWSGTWLLPLAPLLAAAVAAGAVAALAGRSAPRLALPALCVLALAAGSAWEAYDRAQHPNVLAPWIGRRVEIEGRVLDEPRLTSSGRWTHRIETDLLRRPEGEWPLRARLLLPTSPEVRFAPGERVRAAGFLRPVYGPANFGTFDYARSCAREHIYASLHAEGPFVERVGPARLRLDRRLMLGLRDRMMEVHRRSLPPEHAALLNSLVFGSRAAPLAPSVEYDFWLAGATHVLVASGTQVTFIVLVLLYVVRGLCWPRWALVAAALAGAWGYALMAGGGPAVARAAVMVGVVAAAHRTGREVGPASLLCPTALGVLCAHPGLLFDIGFQLSFAAVWGILHCEPPIRWRLPRRPRRLWYLVSASLAAQLATTPLIAYHFCQVPPVGILTNLLAVPLAGILLVGGLAASLLGLVWPDGAYVLDSANLALLALLRWIVGLCARIPGGHFWVVPPGAFTVAVCYVVLALLPRLRREHFGALAANTRLRAAAGGALVLLMGWRVLPGPPALRVTFLDVGQGDSTLVQTPSGRTLLVDGGGVPGAGFDFGERVLLPALLHRGVRRLDCVVLTHPQADHCGGLPAVCRELQVGMLIDPEQPPECQEARDLLKEVGRRRIPRLRAQAGASWLLDPSARITLLHPPEPRLTGTPEDGNNNAVVLRVDYGATALLLAGDVESEAEEHLLRSGMPLDVGVLKVAHHGSRSSTSEGFLARVSPQNLC